MKTDIQGSECAVEVQADRGIVKQLSATSRWALVVAGMGLLAGVLTGCGGTQTTAASGGSGSGGGTTTTTDNPDATGNWEFDFTKTPGTPNMFKSLTGYIKDNVGDTGSTKFTNVEMTETTVANGGTTATCFIGTIPISLTGTTVGAAMDLTSFSINQQYLTTTGTLDSTSSTMTGTYSVTGGCEGGEGSANGQFTGTRYTPLTGTYTGTIAGTSPAATISIAISQLAAGNGAGDFLVSGTASVANSTCFGSGTVATQDPNSYVTGKFANLVFADNTSGSVDDLTLVGTFDVNADTITLSSVGVANGASACTTIGTGTATLTKS
jgi:hypothetical protein